ncbi:LOW QUALITY PROTEIN: receptor-type tyrosine-protein phosphatase T-like [Saccoglossus kowalevskii]
MTIQSTAISESQLKWKHNGDDRVLWDGHSSITITSAKPSDAGIYECYTTQQQRQDGKNSFMRLIVRRCPNGKYGDTCLLNCPKCYNGGICNSDTGKCICPPGFTGSQCNTDPYGCSCLASYTGLDCNTDCPSGKYGAGCTQTCHCTNGCNRKGDCTSSAGDCDTGWSGNKCKVPSSCISGFYGELCNYNCHCKNNAACDKNTGVCPNGDCAPGWINLDTIDSDCQQDGSPHIRNFYNYKVNPGEDTYFICEFSGNPVVASDDMMLWKSETTNYLSPTNYIAENKYIAIGNFSVTVGYPNTGLLSSITVDLYDLPRFSESNKPSVSEDTIHSDQFTVAWKAWNNEEDIGDGPIESYHVYYRESGESVWTSRQVISVTNTSHMSYSSTITGLQWSTEYEITVTVKRPGPLGEGSKNTAITTTTMCAKPKHPTINNIASTVLTIITIEIQFPAIRDIKCNYDGTNGYIELIKVKFRKTSSEDDYQTKIIYITGQSIGIRDFEIVDNTLLPYTEYDIIVLLSNRDEESDPSGIAIVRMAESVPSQPRNVTLAPAVFSITAQWLIPEPTNGRITSYKIVYWVTDDQNRIDTLEITNDLKDVMTYQITDLEYDVVYSIQLTYKVIESVYLSVTPETKDITLNGYIHSHTLALPSGSQVDISITASTTIGFGKPSNIISGTELKEDKLVGILSFLGDRSNLILTDNTATIDLATIAENSDIKSDTNLLNYIIVVEEDIPKRRRDILDNQYITASFPLNAIPDQLMVGDGMEYNGYNNKPLIAGQQYVIHDGLTVYTTGEQRIVLREERLAFFTGT